MNSVSILIMMWGLREAENCKLCDVALAYVFEDSWSKRTKFDATSRPRMAC